MRDHLRTATSAQHARVDASFPDGLGHPADYTRYLLGMHRFAIDFEAATGCAPRHSTWLAHDLAAVGLRPREVVATHPLVTDDDERAGWDYVMAGSSLGARQLARGVRGLGHTADRGACFLTRHGGSDDWPAMLARLAAIDIDDAPQLTRLVRGARDAFTHVAACFAHSNAATALHLEERAA